MARGVFVTGTDTGIGKTWVSLGLMAALQEHGRSVVGMKPVASGCERTRHGLRNEDAVLLQQQGSVPLAYEAVNPYAFEAPIAPHIAAEHLGIRIDPERIAADYRALAGEADEVVVEGVGGWLVPLGPEITVADLAEHLGLPVILVVGLRLGCINHALLTTEAIAARGLPLIGWVANEIDPHMAEKEANLRALRERIAAPLLGVVPHLDTRDPERIAAALGGETLLERAGLS